MRQLLLAIISLLTISCARAQLPPGAGAMMPGAAPPSPSGVTDYGATCNDSTDDTTAINAAFTAARTSTAYAGNRPVKLVGPQDGSHVACKVTSVNATGFTSFGSGAQLIVQGLKLHCTGAGNTCLDTIGDLNIVTYDTELIGDSSTPPSIGLQNGNTNPAVIGCCIQQHYNLQTYGNWSFAALYSAASESTTYYGSVIRNNGATTGVVWSLGSITGGSSYTNGTYAGVSLTGGTGAGAVATIVVSGNAVTSVTLTNQGKGYTINDSLSASAANIGGTGSGFSVPVASIAQFAAVMDGSNHWGVTSAFQTITWTPDTYYTFTQDNFFFGSLRYMDSTHNGSPLWINDLNGAYFYHTYMADQAATACIDAYTNLTGPGNINNYFNIRCETPSTTYEMWLYGNSATPVITGTTLIDDFAEPGTALFGTDTNITGVTWYDAKTDIQSSRVANVPMFSSAKIWSVSGNIIASNTASWNAPANFQGTLQSKGRFALFGSLTPYDIVGGFQMGFSCGRVLNPNYTGPLCQVTRSSDSAVSDLYPDANGLLNPSTYQAFCVNTTCKVNIAYDQSGNGNNCTQTTAASQPTLTVSDIHLGSKPSMTFGDAGAIAITCSSPAPITNIWASGGYFNAVAYQSAGGSTADYVIYKSNGSNAGWFLDLPSGASSQIVQVYAATTNGVWQTTAPGAGAHIYDVYYNSGSVANAPTVAVNGTNETNNSATQPVGAISSDSGLTAVIGNQSVTGGTHGFPGNIAEAIFMNTQPTANQVEALRRNQAVFYGLGAAVN